MRAGGTRGRGLVMTLALSVSGARAGSGAATQPAGAASLTNPEIHAVRMETPPVIDGIVDEPAWQRCPETSGFTHERQPPAQETRVRVGYDTGHLYFAFHCLDPEPGLVRALQTKRNGSMGDDDTVTAGIDPLADRRTAYWFTVNALGTQQEEIPGGAAAKIEWRGDWRAAARRDKDGWTAEMAVPFDILRYPRGQKRFGLIFRRNVSRIAQESTWPPGTDYYTHDNEAFLVDLEAPHVRRRPLIMPYTLTGAGDNAHQSAGLDIKYTTENNVTGLFSVRPDFRTVEDVIDTVDFSYNPRQLDDRRPFFAEGSGYFNDDRMFYSRSVGEIDNGVKLFGKVGGLAFGAMNAARFGHTNDLLLNVKQDLSRYSDWSAALVDHRAEGVGNSVGRLSYHWFRPKKVYSRNFGFDVYKSLSRGRGGDGMLYRFWVDNWAGRDELGWHVYASQVDAGFDPALGYVPEKDLRGADGWLEWSHEYKNGPLLSWDTELDYNQYWHKDGRLFHQGVSPFLGATFRNATRVNLGYDVTNRPPYRDRIANVRFRWSIRDFYRSGDIRFRFGRQAGGSYKFLEAGQGFRLTPKLSTRVGLEMLRLDYRAQPDDHRTQLVLTGLYDISPERGVALRFVGRNDGTNVYAAYRQELRRGADMFFILGDPNARSLTKRVLLKVVNTY